MPDQFVASDTPLLDLLRRHECLTVAQLSEHLGVTPTAVRQRLSRLMAQGLVERRAASGGRGRPSHLYLLTALGRRQAGENFSDLAAALWWELRSIPDPEIRDGLIRRVSGRLAAMYAERVRGGSVSERMEAVARLFRQREIPFEVDHSERGPVLKVLACPYVDLADGDPGVCAMERMLLSEMVGARVAPAACRLEGDRCCAFVPEDATAAR